MPKKTKTNFSLGRQLIKSKDRPKYIKIEGHGGAEGFRNHAVITSSNKGGALESVLEQTTME